MKKILVIFILFSSFLYAKKQELVVNILPQKYFVEKIVKDKFNVIVMVKPGSSPHNFEPKPSQMKSLDTAKAYFLIGDLTESAWLDKFKQNAKNTLFVDTTVGIKKITMVAHTHHDEDEHNNHDKNAHKHEDDKSIHSHDDYSHESGLDPHIWLDPSLVKIQARNIYNAVVNLDSKNKNFYKKNYEDFLLELDTLDRQIKEILKPYQENSFMVFHPSWGYFAKRYDLKQISIEIEGKEPKPSELVELIDEAKEHNIKIIFVAPQFSQKSAKTIANSINGNVVYIDPLTEDWYNGLLNTAKAIANSYK